MYVKETIRIRNNYFWTIFFKKKLTNSFWLCLLMSCNSTSKNRARIFGKLTQVSVTLAFIFLVTYTQSSSDRNIAVIIYFCPAQMNLLFKIFPLFCTLFFYTALLTPTSLPNFRQYLSHDLYCGLQQYCKWTLCVTTFQTHHNCLHSMTHMTAKCRQHGSAYGSGNAVIISAHAWTQGKRSGTQQMYLSGHLHFLQALPSCKEVQHN
jgi:hypothetical protein